jgi:NAD-dependent SIR2 family protein deacetylase|tara:strand:+ start:95 stop:328 length:234 start_codon:yes stop_codon:yes gene_type:complete
MKIGRKKPYSEIGILRISCKRCGKSSTQQWQVCANNNLYLGVCDRCDIELNKMVLRFFRFKNWKKLIKIYDSKPRDN